MSSCGLTHHFWWLSPTSGQIAHVFLTRPPREPPEGDPVRLACIRHAASVDPEPGSNSPPNSSCSPDSSLPQNLRQSWCLLFSLSSTPVNTLSPASRPCSPCPLDQCASSASSSAPHPLLCPARTPCKVSSEPHQRPSPVVASVRPNPPPSSPLTGSTLTCQGAVERLSRSVSAAVFAAAHVY